MKIKKIILLMIIFLNSEMIASNEVGKYSSQNGSLLIKQSGEVFIDYGTNTCIGEFAGKITTRTRNLLTIKSIADNKSKCIVQLKLYTQSVELEEKDCNYYHGDRCDFNGVYTKKGKLPSLKSISNIVTWESLGIGIINPGEVSDWTHFSAKTPQEASVWIHALKPLGTKISYSLNARIWTQAGYSVEEVAKWALLGIDSPRYAQEWLNAGVRNVDEVSRWKKLGFNDVNEVESWIYSGVTRPEDANTWIKVGVLKGRDLAKLQTAGINTPRIFESYKSIGKIDYSELKEWHKAGVTTAEDIMKWESINIQSPQVASAWLQAGVESYDEIKEWKSLGVNNPRECAQLKQLTLTPKDAKVWLENSFTLAEVKSELQRGNYSPSEVKLTRYKNIFWFVVIIIIGFLIYSVLRLKCPSCKSREFTKIDERRHSKGYEQYAKKGNMHTKLKGISDRRGRYEKVYEVFDVTTTYKCDKCDNVFENETEVKEQV